MRPPVPDRSRLRARLLGHVAGLAAAGTALVLTVGIPAVGHASSAASSASSPGSGAGLPFGTGSPDDSTVDTPAEASASAALLTGGLSDAGLISAVDDAVASSLAASGIPSTALDAYQRAADAAPAGCRISWTLIAAIGRVESNHGRFAGAVLHEDGLSTPPILGPRLDGNGFAAIPDTDGGRLDGDPTYDRAVGPMQFIPSTWAAFGVDGNGDGKADPFNIFDAARAAADYLCSAGGDLSTVAGQQRAVLAYNHSDSYVATVLGLAAQYAGEVPPVLETSPPIPAEVPPVNPGPPPALPAASVVPSPSAGTTSPAAAAPAATSTAPQSSASAPSSQGSTSAAPTSSSAPSSTASPTTTPPSSSSASSSSSSSSSSSGSSTPTTSTPPSSSSNSTTPTPTPTPTTSSTCPVNPGTTTPVTVDVIDETGNAANGNNAIADLKAAGLTAGTLTSKAGSDASAIQYPTTLQDQARQFAADLQEESLLAQAGVPHITLVLGASDSGPLLAALHQAAASPVCPAH